MKGVKYKTPSFFTRFKEGMGMGASFHPHPKFRGQAAFGGGWRRLSFSKQDIYLDNRAGIALILIERYEL